MPARKSSFRWAWLLNRCLGKQGGCASSALSIASATRLAKRVAASMPQGRLSDSKLARSSRVFNLFLLAALQYPWARSCSRSRWGVRRGGLPCRGWHHRGPEPGRDTKPLNTAWRTRWVAAARVLRCRCRSAWPGRLRPAAGIPETRRRTCSCQFPRAPERRGHRLSRRS